MKDYNQNEQLMEKQPFELLVFDKYVSQCSGRKFE